MKLGNCYCTDITYHISNSQVREKYSNGTLWSRAMDEVRVERLVAKYEDGGSDPKDDPLLVLLKKWPESGKYKENPRLRASLEHQVIVSQICISLTLFILSFSQYYPDFWSFVIVMP